jgi:hypothetical protein
MSSLLLLLHPLVTSAATGVVPATPLGPNATTALLQQVRTCGKIIPGPLASAVVSRVGLSALS